MTSLRPPREDSSVGQPVFRHSGSPAKIGILFGIGVLLVQLAWSIAVPAFHGIDEFDHAYRASAVANGEWRAEPSPATRGTGAMLSVSRDIVVAAGPFCRELRYTVDSDCEPQGEAGDGLVYASSGAGRYNPAFYALVGWPDLLLRGDGSLLAMRAVGAAIMSLMIGLAAYVLAGIGRGSAPLLGLVVGLTPVEVYSGSIVAPNGLEIAAAAALWSCLLTWSLHERVPTRMQSHLVWIAALAATVLLTVRSMGPVWLALIVLSISPLMSRADLRALPAVARRNLLPLGIVLVGGLLSCLWILGNRSLEIGRDGTGTPDPVLTSLKQIPLWLFQSIAAVPFRNEAAPTGVYAAVLLAGIVLVSLGLARGSTRIRVSMGSVLALSVLVPFAITLATIDTFGAAWQGRYGLPLSIGLPMIAGVSLARRPLDRRNSGLLIFGTLLTVGVAQMWSVGFVFHIEWDGSLVSPWFTAAMTASLLGVLMVVKAVSHADSLTDALGRAPHTGL